MQIAFAEKPTDAVAEDGSRDVVTITFGTGEMSGVYVRDTLCLGHTNSVCFPTDFVAATDESDEPFAKAPFEGPAFSIVQRLGDSGTMQRPLFAVFFGNDSEDSEITFGRYDKRRMASELMWLPVTEPGYWQIKVDSVVVGGQTMDPCSGDRGCQVAVDTGTSLLAGPSDVVESLVERLHVAMDCSNKLNLPDLTFVVGNVSLALSPDDYVSQTAGSCSLGLMAMDIPPPKGPLYIFGDPFLRKYYTVYDLEGPRVGLALANHNAIVDKPSAGNQEVDTRHGDVRKPFLRKRTSATV